MGQRGQESDPIKKDRQSVEGVRREIDEETPGGSGTEAMQRDRNRDAARGDWDRTNRRFDEGVSREDEIGEGTRADALYPERVRRPDDEEPKD